MYGSLALRAWCIATNTAIPVPMAVTREGREVDQ